MIILCDKQNGVKVVVLYLQD